MPTTLDIARASRQQQLRLRAVTLQQLLQLWPIWRLDEPDSFAAFAAATVPLLRARHDESSRLASAAYGATRRVAGVTGTAPQRLATFNAARAVTSLYVTGPVLTGKAVAAGVALEAAREVALVRITGTAARLVLDGGRETARLTGQADPRRTGWRRITGGSACSWCLERAAAAENGDPTGAFGGHDHCGCEPAPTF